MESLKYFLLDVFTVQRFEGNQLAIFPFKKPLTTEIMQKIARELNLSETVFMFPPSDPSKTIKLRIFTPQKELPVAGHPTVGTAFLLGLENLIKTVDGKNEWILEENIGDIPVTVYKDKGVILKAEMSQPTPVFGDSFRDIEAIASLLSLSKNDIRTNLPIQTVSSGVPFLYVPLTSQSAMKRIHFRNDIWQHAFASNENTQHIFAFTSEVVYPDSTVHGRMFAPALGIPEDPATGIASGPLGAYLIEHSVIPLSKHERYLIRSEQGLHIGRPSFIDISISKKGGLFEEVKVGGTSVKIGEGHIFI